MTTTDESRPAEQEPTPINWKAWLSLPRVALWKGVALVNGIDPESLRQSDSGWMAGPGNGPVFESSSFPSPSKRDAFDDAMGWAEKAAGYGDDAPICLTVGFVHGARYRNAEVSLTEVVAYFMGMDWPGIPAPLLGATKPLAVDANTQASESAQAVAREAVDAKRIAEGWYFIDEAASAIAHQQGFNGMWSAQFCSLMVQEAQRGALPVCHPSTRLPIRDARPLSTTYLVTRDGVNRWLDALEAQGAQGVGYRWEAEPKPQAEPVPLLAQSDTQHKETIARAPPLTSTEIASAFDDIYGLSEAQWKKKLSDLNNSAWLLSAMVVRGKAPKPSTWNPVKFAELLQKKGVTAAALSRRFFSAPTLRPWLTSWQESTRALNDFGR